MRAGIREVRNKDETVEAEAARKLYRSDDYGLKEGILGIPRVRRFRFMTAISCQGTLALPIAYRSKFLNSTALFLRR
jgi:hypothetical protein